MKILIESHRLFLQDLISANVEFLLVGGYAVNFHGYRRSTGDLDLWLKPSNENKNKLLAFLKKYDFEQSDIDYLETKNFEDMVAFHFDQEPERIDFLTKLSGVQWEDAWENKVTAEVEGLRIPLIHKNDLILAKMNTGRAQDKADIEGLQKHDGDQEV